jgi:hypothetical protein
MNNRNHLLYPTAKASSVRPKLLACVFLVAALLGAASQAATAGLLVPPAPKDKQTATVAKTLLKLPLRFEGTVDRQAMAGFTGSGDFSFVSNAGFSSPIFQNGCEQLLLGPSRPERPAPIP